MQTMLNDTQGRRLAFLESTPQKLRLDEFLSPGAKPVPPHLHVKQTERFEVRSGRLKMQLGKNERILEAGESLVIPTGVPHTYWNPFEQEVQVQVELDPALNYKRFFESIYGLAREGLLPAQGSPNPLLGALLLSEYELYLEGLPISFQKVVFGIMAKFAKILGYKVWKPEYQAEPLDSLVTSDSKLISEPKQVSSGHRF
jgi:mannose-6-phosphate isomerase-like protein (cupin superfamily)